jgi:tetratricopeptide (TPR) repeat protein
MNAASVTSALAALQSRDFAGAERMLRAHLRARPDDVEALRLLGIALHQQGRHAEALAQLRVAAKRAPMRAEIHTNLGSVLRALGDTTAALDAFARATELAPELAPAWYNLGKAQLADARVDTALMSLQRAVTLDPAHHDARLTLADAQKALGDIVTAADNYRQVARAQPARGRAWWGIANLKTVALDDAERERLRRAWQQHAAHDDERIMLGHAYARALEAVGEYDQALAVLDAANAMRRTRLPWDAAAHRRHVDAILAAPIAPPEATAVQRGSEVIFIVGMPRSGSTLIEQTLAAHPDVCGASELPDLPAVIAAESRARGKAYPSWVGEASADDWRRLGEAYLARTARWRTQHPRSTDKWPNNIEYVGVIARMLPGACVVRTERDVADVAWSCYQQFFARAQPWSCALTDIAEYMVAERRLARHWRTTLPGKVLEVRYEAWVRDAQTQLRALLAHCALPFDAACLSPHLEARAVRTASAAQVREPLHGAAIGRARPYAARLQTVLDRLAAAEGQR